MRKFRFLICLLTTVMLWTACSPTAVTPTPTSVPQQPTSAEAATPQGESSLFQTGRRYSDAPGDMAVSFLDVVAFQATVDDEAGMLSVLLQMRDIPETADLGHVKNLIEYSWRIDIYTDSSRVERADYYLALNTSVRDPSAGHSLTPIPGEPEQVPVYQIFENRSIYTYAGQPRGDLQVEVNPDRNTLLLTGRVPKITSEAVFSFITSHYPGNTDEPDHYVAPASANLSTPRPVLNPPTLETPTQLVPVGAVRAFPGPRHYAGDVLTFEIANDGVFGDATVNVEMTIDNGTPIPVPAESTWTGLLLPLALDTTNLIGQHTVSFTTADGTLNEIYSFEVLPAEQRPANEARAEWTSTQTECCIYHYITETAAARDIGFISEHFQTAADEFESITEQELHSKFNVYIIDTMWGNGGFGGNGELVISYTDRYYGPIRDGNGLKILARHEFTHAAGIGLAGTGSGVNFNYEGLAVYVAGGHYKPEPLAERGAALHELGYYVPVGQYLMQHELAYLYPAAMLTYIEKTYGKDAMWAFLASDDNLEDDQPGDLEAAIQAVFGISLKEFDQAFQAWLETHEPGEQLEDLRLTIELQDLRRLYQNTYVPPANFLLAEAVSAAARPEYLPVVIREAREPAHIAVELIIANGQQAILHGDYAEAEGINRVLAEILEDGSFDNPIAQEYLGIVRAAAAEGYEVVHLDIQGEHADARVTSAPPALSDLMFEKADGTWQIQP